MSKPDFSGLDLGDELDQEFMKWINAGIAIGREYRQEDIFELYNAFRAGWFGRGLHPNWTGLTESKESSQ